MMAVAGSVRHQRKKIHEIHSFVFFLEPLQMSRKCVNKIKIWEHIKTYMM